MSHLRRRVPCTGALLLCAIVPAVPVLADEAGDSDLAMQLSNPVAALISVPLQLNYDQDIGPADDGDRWLLNVQPVIPFSLNDDWNLISRTILPVVRQSDIFPGAGTQTGVGDVVQSIFFSPTAPTASGWIWGAGPVLLLPTGSNDLLTTDKWGAGPTAVVLKQSNARNYLGAPTRGGTARAISRAIWSMMRIPWSVEPLRVSAVTLPRQSNRPVARSSMNMSTEPSRTRCSRGSTDAGGG